MTRPEAFALLQLDPGSAAGGDEIRRAYFRRIKVVKPEVDPAGFAQLRTAYELLSQERANVVFSAMPLRDPPAGSAQPAPTSSRQTDAEPNAEPAASPPDSPASESESEPEPDPFEPYRQRLANLPYHEQLAVARQAVAALPDSVPARWRLYSFLADSVASEEAVSILREGAQRHPDVFLDEFLYRYPARVPAALLRDGAAGASLLRRLLIIDALVEQGQIVRALDHYQATLTAKDVDFAESVVLGAALRPVLSMHACAQVHAASQALALLKQVAGPLALDATRVAPAVAVAFTIADELGRFGSDLPLDLRQVAARAAKSGDYSMAPAEARFAARMLGDRQIRRWAKKLKERAPTVSGIMGLQALPVRRDWSFQFSWRWVVIPLLLVIRCLSQSSSGPSLRVLDTSTPPVLVDRGLGRLAVEDRCNSPSSPSVCMDLLPLAAALSDPDVHCSRLWARLTNITQKTLAPPGSPRQVALDAMASDLRRRCAP